MSSVEEYAFEILQLLEIKLMLRHSLSRWKFALLALLVFFTAMSNTAMADACTVNCLRVYSIDVSDLGSSIRGIVRLTNESGAATASRGSVVHVMWTRPDGTVYDQYAIIGTRLRARFSLSTAGAPGAYTLTVAGATLSGYTFDPDNSSMTSKSITIGDLANSAPTAVSNADVVSGSAPLTVNFDSYGSGDPDGAIVAYTWDFGDGSSSSEASPTHVYQGVGNFDAALTVTDNMGSKASSSTSITVMDNDAGCISNCMSVDRISLSYSIFQSRITGLVWLVDENNRPIKGAVVHAVWTLPDGSTHDSYSRIGTRMRASFSLTATAAGRYTLNIVEVTNTDYTFSPDSSNVTEDSIDVTP
jgi:PKD repeat protein